MAKYPEDDTLVAQYAASAEEMIENYLGYSPEKKDYQTRRYGDDGFLFELEAIPLAELTYADVNGNALDVSDFRIKSRNYLEFNFGKNRFCKDSLYTFRYTAGYEVKTLGEQIAEEEENGAPDKSGNPEESAEAEEGISEEKKEEQSLDSITVNKVPAKIRTAALQIASLIWESSGGNIAVSSTSYADSGSRTFNNYSAERILKDLEPYRLAKGGDF